MTTFKKSDYIKQPKIPPRPMPKRNIVPEDSLQAMVDEYEKLFSLYKSKAGRVNCEIENKLFDIIVSIKAWEVQNPNLPQMKNPPEAPAPRQCPPEKVIIQPISKPERFKIPLSTPEWPNGIPDDNYDFLYLKSIRKAIIWFLDLLDTIPESWYKPKSPYV